MRYTIKQMAEMFGVTEHTLRFYTDKGLLPCERDSGNRRVFTEESVNWMQGIQCLKGCGVSLEDIPGVLPPVPAGRIRGKSAGAVCDHPETEGRSL